MGNEKNPGYEIIQDPERIKSIVESELKNFKKGFGIDIKTYKDFTNVPDSVKLIIEQYYTSAILMVPNVTRNSGAPPYISSKSGVVFQNGRDKLFERIKRIQKGIDLLIELYPRLEKATDEEKILIMTHIKLVETDISSNLAHTYDIPRTKDDKEEWGSLGFNSVKSFKENYNYIDHLDHIGENDYNRKTRRSAIGKYIRNAMADLNASIGGNDRLNLGISDDKDAKKITSKNIDLNNFIITCHAWLKTGLRRQKHNGIIELINGNYEVIPVIATIPREEVYSTEKLDQILFVGKIDNISVSIWHFGSSRELATSKEVENIQKTRYPLKDIKPLIHRGYFSSKEKAMPNMEILEHSINRDKSPLLDKDATSLLEKLIELKQLKAEQTKCNGNNLKILDYGRMINDLEAVILIPEGLSDNCKKMIEDLHIDDLVDELTKSQVQKERWNG